MPQKYRKRDSKNESRSDRLPHRRGGGFTKEVFVREDGCSGTALFNEVGINVIGDRWLRVTHLLGHVNYVLALRDLP